MSRASEDSAAIVVVGYGNTLRGDDGIGWRAVESLARRNLPASTVVLTAHQLDPELARTIAQAKLALFVDAERGGKPGSVRCQAVSSDAPDSDFSHQLTPAALLALAQNLYGTSPVAFEITMCGEGFDVGEGLSPICEAALPRLVEAIAQKIGI